MLSAFLLISISWFHTAIMQRTTQQTHMGELQLKCCLQTWVCESELGWLVGSICIHSNDATDTGTVCSGSWSGIFPGLKSPSGLYSRPFKKDSAGARSMALTESLRQLSSPSQKENDHDPNLYSLASQSRSQADTTVDDPIYQHADHDEHLYDLGRSSHLQRGPTISIDHDGLTVPTDGMSSTSATRREIEISSNGVDGDEVDAVYNTMMALQETRGASAGKSYYAQATEMDDDQPIYRTASPRDDEIPVYRASFDTEPDYATTPTKINGIRSWVLPR